MRISWQWGCGCSPTLANQRQTTLQATRVDDIEKRNVCSTIILCNTSRTKANMFDYVPLAHKNRLTSYKIDQVVKPSLLSFQGYSWSDTTAKVPNYKEHWQLPVYRLSSSG